MVTWRRTVRRSLRRRVTAAPRVAQQRALSCGAGLRAPPSLAEVGSQSRRGERPPRNRERQIAPPPRAPLPQETDVGNPTSLCRLSMAARAETTNRRWEPNLTLQTLDGRARRNDESTLGTQSHLVDAPRAAARRSGRGHAVALRGNVLGCALPGVTSRRGSRAPKCLFCSSDRQR